MSLAVQTHPPALSPLAGNLACMASTLIWSLGFPLADSLLTHLPPVTVTVLRLCFASALLLPLWVLMEGRQAVVRARWLPGLLVGAIGLGLGSLLLIYAQKRTDGVTVASITATLPAVAIALECLFDGRRLSLRLVFGIALSVLGGLAVYGARMGHMNLGLGAAAAFASVFVFAWASRASVTALPGLSAIGRTAVTIAGGMIVVVLVQAAQPILGAPPPDLAALSGRDWLFAAIYGAGSLAISQVLFLIAVARLGIGIASMHINVAPFYVMLLSLAFGAGWNWGQVWAAGLVVIGVVIAQSGPRRPA